MGRSAAADTELATWHISTPVRVEYLAFTSDEMFGRVWDSGLFQAINDECDSLIDDYEEEELKPEQVKRILPVLDSVLRKTSDSVVVAFVEELRAMAEEAVRKEFCLYFVL